MNTLNTRIRLRPLRPRNPVALPGRQRRAGAHETTPGGQRQLAERSLRREIERLRDTT